MAAQLLPFQKMADIPDVAQRHRCAIRGLAITSIVLVFSILFFGLIPTMVTITTTSPYSYETILMVWLGGVPLMTIVLLLVLASSIISLRNTDKWAPADACCNLMRSQPACCTKSCGGNKHCCARLSSVFIAASAFSSLLFVLLVASLIAGCTVVSYYFDGRTSDTAGYGIAILGLGGNTAPYIAKDNAICERMSRAEPAGLILLVCLIATTALAAWLVRAIEKEQADIAVLSPNKMVVQVTAGNMTMMQRPVVGNVCVVAAGLILLECLIATTARVVRLVRAIEKEQADIAVLPPNKMVAQVTAGNMTMMQRTVVGHVCVVDEEEPKTETRTEQNVQNV